MTNAVQFKVGKYTCCVTLPEIRPGTVAHINVEWDPCMPKRPLTDSERKEYDAGMMLALSGNGALRHEGQP